MTRAPVALVATLRETSVIFAAVIAFVIFKEKISPPAHCRHLRRARRPGGAADAEMRTTSPWVVACCGLAALAVAMGVGRFAFTPVLPMIQDNLGVTLAEGGWLASANYFGYLAGALSASLVADVARRGAIRLGLVTIALSTLAMGAAEGFTAWAVLRFLAGFPSTWAFGLRSAWALDLLGKAGRPFLGGTVYAGVGVGIVLAGVACLGPEPLGQRFTSRRGSSSARLGPCSRGDLALWPLVGSDVAGDSRIAKAGGEPIPRVLAVRVLPRRVRSGLHHPGHFSSGDGEAGRRLEPLWFGLAWPVFGIAAAVSTLAAAPLTRVVGQRKVWILGNIAMGIGVLVPMWYQASSPASPSRQSASAGLSWSTLWSACRRRAA